MLSTTLVRRALLSLVICVVGVSGCLGRSDRGIPKGKIEGTVTYKGTPVSEGRVFLSSPTTGIAIAMNLDESGKFQMSEGLEVGSYEVNITPPLVEEVAGAPTTTKPKDYPNIPKKYRTSSTSGFTAEVVKGNNTFTFAME
ncbi:hypothetical protein [Planctomicrobium sp. SH527]|uniref:hypothetical protein n=1 Tax=Planctomicrobium sp. SH527 TaxID=3448123 RepID=UPI003F5BD2A1